MHKINHNAEIPVSLACEFPRLREFLKSSNFDLAVPDGILVRDLSMTLHFKWQCQEALHTMLWTAEDSVLFFCIIYSDDSKKTGNIPIQFNYFNFIASDIGKNLNRAFLDFNTLGPSFHVSI